MRGLYLPSKPPKAPEGELGHLTWLRFSAGDKSSSVFRCRCGEQVIRPTRSVRRAAELGRVVACDACTKLIKGAV